MDLDILRNLLTTEDVKMKIVDVSEGDVVNVDFRKKKNAEPERKIPEPEQKIPMTLMQAFGSLAMNILHDAGINFLEKPGYFEELERPDGKYRPLNEVTFKKVMNTFRDANIHIPVYSSDQIWGGDPPWPQKKYINKPNDETILVRFNNGKTYLIDTTQAQTYARMWILVNV